MRRVLAPAVASSTATPFTYLPNDPAAPALETVGDPSTLDDVRYVDVELEVGSTTVGAYSNVLTSTTIGLPNVMQENL